MKKLSISILLLSIALSIALSSYIMPRRFIGRDQALHFYDMKRHLESARLPTTSARFEGTPLKKGEYTTPRVPGGAFYSLYVGFYKFAKENLFLSRVINLVFNYMIAFYFLLWVYKRFGLFIVSIFSALLLINGYFLIGITDFWNPNLTLIFSLLFLMLFFEYVYESKERNRKLAAVFIFPVLAIMAQGHFATFFSMIPTVIVYLAIRFKKTKKYLIYFALGVFIAFLLYLPYLVSELQSNFNNLKLALSTRNTITAFPFPQFHALFIFPTNEMSVFLGTRIHIIKYFWTTKPLYIFGMIFIVITLLFSLFCFIRAIILFFRNKIVLENNEKKENAKLYIALKETIFLIILFMPITLICFIVGKSKPGIFHYLYSSYGLSFIPIILFFTQNKNKIINDNKKAIILTSLITLNMFALSGQIIRYIKMFEEKRNYTVMRELAEFFRDDANGRPMKILSKYKGDMSYAYMDIIDTYFPEYNINTSDEPEIYYVVRDNIMMANWSDDIKKENDNYVMNNATEITNIGAHTVFKFNEGYKE